MSISKNHIKFSFVGLIAPNNLSMSKKSYTNNLSVIKKKYGVFNIGSDELYSIKEIVETGAIVRNFGSYPEYI